MKIGVPKEIHEGERRVATTPDVAVLIQKLGFEVAVESEAGSAAKFTDSAYTEAGAEIVKDGASLYEQSDIILKVRAPGIDQKTGVNECELLREGQTLISFIQPGQNEELMNDLAARNISVLAMDSIPRISRAQKWMP